MCYKISEFFVFLPISQFHLTCHNYCVIFLSCLPKRIPLLSISPAKSEGSTTRENKSLWTTPSLIVPLINVLAGLLIDVFAGPFISRLSNVSSVWIKRSFRELFYERTVSDTF